MLTTQAEIVDCLLKNRQITDRERFFTPDYDQTLADHDPFGLVDMDKAVMRLTQALAEEQSIVIFGDYDADGVTSTALLLDALGSFGFKKVNYYLPNRFTNGYGLTVRSVDEIAEKFAPQLLITVDCGSLNHAEIGHANQLGIDVIVTDHHNLAEVQPPAVAVINPKRPENSYPNRNLAGVGTAFALVRALQTKLETLQPGQEKWLLDLVAVGTIADLMELSGENRVLAKYGLKVLQRTRRIGLKHLLDKNKIEQISAESVGFIVGPRMNAAGRMDKADFALEVLTAKTLAEADERLDKLDYLNAKRRAFQDKIYQEAAKQAKISQDPVLVLKGEDWHEGVVGIVASRIQEEFQKPVFILSQKNDEVKGSARSFGRFSVFEAIESVRDLLKTGGGHDAAGGVSFAAANFEQFRSRINQFYRSLDLDLSEQLQFLEPQAEVTLANFNLLDKKLYQQLAQFEPFGAGNPQPIFKVSNLEIIQVIFLGNDNQHLKIKLGDDQGNQLEMLSFNYNKAWTIRLADKVEVIFTLSINSWNGQEKLQGRLLKITTL